MGKSDVRETLARSIKQERTKHNLTRAQLAEQATGKQGWQLLIATRFA